MGFKTHYVESTIARVLRFMARRSSQGKPGDDRRDSIFPRLAVDVPTAAGGPSGEAPRRGSKKRQADAVVLLVGNDLDAADEIRFHLQASGHPVWLSQTTHDALRAARSGWPSVLVVDRAVNGEDGLSIVETLRREGNFTPILVVGPPSSVDERISGLKAGADDYLVNACNAFRSPLNQENRPSVEIVACSRRRWDVVHGRRTD